MLVTDKNYIIRLIDKKNPDNEDYIKGLMVLATIILTAVIGTIALKVIWTVLQTVFIIPNLSWIKAFILCFAGRFVVGSVSEIKFNKED